MILIEVDELRRQKTAINTDFNKRMSEFNDGIVKKMPCRTNFPQHQYACCCPTMRTYCGDIISSTCKDCIKNGVAIPNCPMCKCQCQTGIFTKKDIMSMANEKLQKDKLKAHERIPDKDERAHRSFAQIPLANSVKQGFESLSNSKSRLDENNVLSAATGHMSMSCKQFEQQLL